MQHAEMEEIVLQHKGMKRNWHKVKLNKLKLKLMTKLQYSIKKPEMEWNEMEVEQS